MFFCLILGSLLDFLKSPAGRKLKFHKLIDFCAQVKPNTHTDQKQNDKNPKFPKYDTP